MKGFVGRVAFYRGLKTLPRRSGTLLVSQASHHFIRQFEALFGITPHQLRMRERIELAKLLLAQGDLSVTEVCMEVGMSSLGSFSALFQQRVGIAPSQYRRKARSFIVVPGILPEKLFPACLTLMAHLPANAFRSFPNQVRNFQEAHPT